MGFYELTRFIEINRVLALVFVVWVWVARVVWGKDQIAGRRVQVLLVAKAFVTCGAAIGLLCMLAPARLNLQIGAVAVVSLFVGCAALILALLGKGKGRIATAVASLELALSWLPFVLP